MHLPNMTNCPTASRPKTSGRPRLPWQKSRRSAPKQTLHFKRPRRCGFRRKKVPRTASSRVRLTNMPR
ncbi:hypothetical protein ATCV1_z514L [Acanthocystis turfacea chlorella virus 1]|uniref:Uncharacterized protein z514L n=1 Tax=Chlorovirus heliozoae TaxID=322019 RepID=A7K9C4_9PHYC|nr:hypothetical protein ATCV1_z514L [Acanthocystis turfacea chlorella virus 1]ABT16648.1 hypothetical protein ATCV1_z514L [Acanthocystis turfacea chlorella virus 1]